MSYKIAEFHRVVDELAEAAPLTSEQELTLLKAVLSLVRQSQNLRQAREFHTGAKMPHIESGRPQS